MPLSILYSNSTQSLIIFPCSKYSNASICAIRSDESCFASCDSQLQSEIHTNRIYIKSHQFAILRLIVADSILALMRTDIRLTCRSFYVINANGRLSDEKYCLLSLLLNNYQIDKASSKDK